MTLVDWLKAKKMHIYQCSKAVQRYKFSTYSSIRVSSGQDVITWSAQYRSSASFLVYSQSYTIYGAFECRLESLLIISTSSCFLCHSNLFDGFVFVSRPHYDLIDFQLVLVVLKAKEMHRERYVSTFASHL